MSFNPHDHYFKLAKKEGFLARSAYKLDEIQKRYRLIKPHYKVLDLGCAPGAWSQIVLKILDKNGVLRGVDLKAVTLTSPQAAFIQKDIFAMGLSEFVEAPYDVIISDMAPNTSGIAIRDQTLSEELCFKVIALCDQILKPKGHVVMKLFMGGDAKKVELEVKKRFLKHQLYRPKSTRKESSEIYLIGIERNK